ncbi:hypothetical protein NAMH_1390 [Nautilia profundicola AmH]|uniref:Uncharacterized protein n=1 Tax=Nautilia profundicola (strain ATCC BAA-1463 / DSM 18972 / AmH) TaxID=598659 RepID=B9L5Z5_NAUPA|nr:hypothetical protein [Nautilia profundicola]ACM92169.1 hypothetical protein NAMH_1390 [Nautilia profundicola AmH]
MKNILLTFFFSSVLFANSNLCNLLPKNLNNYKESSKCEYTNIQSNYGKSSQAYKEYKNGNKKISIQLIKGSMAYQMMTPFMMPVQVETNDMIMKITTCKNFKCAITYDKKENGGVIIVLIEQNIPVILTLTYEKMNIDEAMNLINKLDLKKIKNSL